MNLKNVISKIKNGVAVSTNFAVDMICPKICIICGGFADAGSSMSLCRICRTAVHKFGKSSVDDRVAYEEAVCALEYDNSVRDAMMRYKFGGKKYLYRTFAEVLLHKLENRSFMSEINTICPVPLHPLRVRDYNQSALIARYISEHTGKEYIEDLLIKTKNIRPLSTMNYTQRRQFVRNTMNPNFKYDLSGRSILIVDDIFTSGATISECARILKIYGAHKVYAAAVCYAKPGEAVLITAD